MVVAKSEVNVCLAQQVQLRKFGVAHFLTAQKLFAVAAEAPAAQFDALLVANKIFTNSMGFLARGLYESIASSFRHTKLSMSATL